MTYRDDVAELRAIATELRGYVTRCDALVKFLGDKTSFTADERRSVRNLYVAIKTDLQCARATGSISKKMTAVTEAELQWYSPIVAKAWDNLAADGHEDPLTCNFRGFTVATRNTLAKGLAAVESALSQAR